MIGSLFALLGSFALPLLMKLGVSEGAAGAFVMTRKFKALSTLGLIGIAALAVWLGLVIHDKHLTEVVTVKCQAELRAEALQKEVNSLKVAVAQKDEALRERGLVLARNATEIQQLREKNSALRSQSAGRGRLVFDANDAWVRALVGDADGGSDNPDRGRPR